MLRFAYNTIGCAYHRLDDALELMAEAGYSGVTLSLDCFHFDPFADDWEARASRLGERLSALDLAVALHTHAGFLLDPREPGEPTLLHPTDAGRDRRLDLLKRAVRIAAACNAEAVTLVSGRPRRDVSQANAALWLIDGLSQIADFAGKEGIPLALQPEPGHMVGTLDDFKAVREALKQATDASLGLTISLSNCHITKDRDPSFAIKEFAGVLTSVSIADAKHGVSDPLPPGQGEMDLPAALLALEEIQFEGLVSVELPTQSSRAHRMIEETYGWLQDNLPSD